MFDDVWGIRVVFILIVEESKFCCLMKDIRVIILNREMEVIIIWVYIFKVKWFIVIVLKVFIKVFCILIIVVVFCC